MTESSDPYSENTPQGDILAIIGALRDTYNSKVTLSYNWRVQQLKKLQNLVNDKALEVALYNDLHRSNFESNMLELDLIRHEITTALNNLDNWMRVQSKSTNLANLPAFSYVKHDPLGVALVMSPWNYPLLLTFQPMVGALAAGNTVLLRPANYSDNVSATILMLVDKYFNDDLNTIHYSTNPPQSPSPSPQQDQALIPSANKSFRQGLPVYVVLGDRHVTDFVLDQKFDYIFFTGGPHLGKIVLSKASRYLTPCTIELGGKSPIIIDKDCGDLDVVAKRLVWAAFLNSGQTCVRPDYAFIHSKVIQKLLPLVKKYILQFYGNYLSNSTKVLSGDELEYHFMSSPSTTSPPLTAPIPIQINSSPVTESDSLLGSGREGGVAASEEGGVSSSTSSSQTTKTSKTTQVPPNVSSISLPSFASLLSPTISTAVLNYKYGTFEHAMSTGDDNSEGKDSNGQNGPKADSDNFSSFKQICNSPYFGRIINSANFNRLVGCLVGDRDHIYCGGVYDRNTSFISPTILKFPDYQTFSQSLSMQDELFGPLLPCVAFDDLSSVVNHIRANHKPLALYCFTTSSKTKEIVQNETSSGSLVFNDAIVQLSNGDLPFGGVGFSGYGTYHGFFSFQTFSHQKAVMSKTTWFDIFARYPPYTIAKRRVFTLLHFIDSVGNFFAQCRAKIRRVWYDKTPLIVRILIILTILAGVCCGFYWGILPSLMKLLKLCVEKYYHEQCQ